MRTSSAAPFHARLTPLAASIAIACTNAFAATYTVTNTNASGASSLRQAILDANANCSADPAPVIQFAITGPAPFTITPSSPLPLPAFSCISSYTPTVDASMQPGVAIDGSSVTGSVDANGLEALQPAILTVKGIDVHAFSYGGASNGIKGRVKVYGSTITGNDNGIYALTGSEIGDISDPSKGNRIAGNVGEGIYVYGSGVTIANNYIGTLDGDNAAANGTGVYVFGAPTTISANVISGNIGNGIRVDVGNVTISDNRIGTNASGSSALRNGGYGIEARSSASDTITGNTISGNQNGMIVWSSDTSTTISSNKIGTNKDGTAAIPNVDVGLNFDCGGWPSGGSVASNIISGNGGNGLEIFGVDWLTVSGNKIGVAANGTTAIGNGGHGVVLGDGECSNPWNNVLSGNTIANNGLAGVEFATGKMNTATQNRIYANSRINIDMENYYAYGAFPNDDLQFDVDTGANNRQNYPVDIVVTQEPGGLSTTIAFTLNTTAGTFTIEAFENPGTGIGAGHTYLDSTTVSSSGATATAGSLTISGAHDFISLTATSPASPTGDTSEFSPITTVTPTPGVSLSATALDFWGVPMGSTSSPQTVTLTSVGSAPYVINSFDTSSPCYGGSTLPCSGGFSCSSNCVTGSETTSCSISATFTPNYVGEDSSDIYICDNTSNSPQLISLYGTGVVPPPLTLSPASFDFGNVLLGSKTPAQSFIVFNPGGAPVEIGTPTTTAADFVVASSTCGTSVSPASRCTVGVAFQPQARGFRTGDLVIPAASPQYGDLPYILSSVAASAILSGDGVVQAQLSAPATIDLGPYILGDPPLSRTVPIGNAGNGVLTFSSIGASGPFTMSHDCPLNLSPGESCSVVLGFSAGVAGTATGALTIVTNAAGGTRSIPVTALAQAQAVPVLQVTPTLLGFGSRMVGTMSPSQRVTITNIGGADATLASLDINVEYLVSSTCGLTLAPGSSCFADVTFKPLGFGPRPGTLTIPANDAGSPHGVILGGTGCRPFMIGRSSANRCAP